MKRNVGDLDSRIRSRFGLIMILVGVLGLVGLLTIGITVEIVLLIVGAILFLTGSFRTCAIYSILGISTSKETQKKGEDIE